MGGGGREAGSGDLLAGGQAEPSTALQALPGRGGEWEPTGVPLGAPGGFGFMQGQRGWLPSAILFSRRNWSQVSPRSEGQGPA